MKKKTGRDWTLRIFFYAPVGMTAEEDSFQVWTRRSTLRYKGPSDIWDQTLQETHSKKYLNTFVLAWKMCTAYNDNKEIE